MQLYRSWEWTDGGPAGCSGWGLLTCRWRKGQWGWCRLFIAWRGDGFGGSNRRPLVQGSHQKTDPGFLRRFHDRKTRNNSHTLEIKIYQVVQSKQKPPKTNISRAVTQWNRLSRKEKNVPLWNTYEIHFLREYTQRKSVILKIFDKHDPFLAPFVSV